MRHKDWFGIEANRDALFELLRELHIGTVISDTAGRRDCAHMELTTSEAVIRFVGNDLAPSDFTRMDQWGRKAEGLEGYGIKDSVVLYASE